MVIKTLRLQNFKSHKDTTIEFSPITTVIGKNDAGKSNVLRALVAILFNGNFPASWIRYGTTRSTVTASLADGTKLVRTRTPSSQELKVFQPGKDTLEFTGKADATQTLSDLTGLKLVRLDETVGPENLNYLPVHAGPFILGGHPGPAMRKISNLIGGGEIEDAKSRLVRRSRSLAAKGEVLQEEIEEMEREKESLNALLSKTSPVESQVDRLVSLLEENQSSLEKLLSLQESLRGIDASTPDMFALQEKLSEVLQEYSGLQEKADFLSTLEEKRNILSANVHESGKISSQLDQARQALEELERQRHQALVELGKCPTCGREM